MPGGCGDTGGIGVSPAGCRPPSSRRRKRDGGGGWGGGWEHITERGWGAPGKLRCPGGVGDARPAAREARSWAVAVIPCAARRRVRPSGSERVVAVRGRCWERSRSAAAATRHRALHK